LLENPEGNINPRYTDLLVDLKGKRILNALGSNGRKAVPLCLLGAAVTIIDISEENRLYALELAQHAGVHLDYVVADFVSYHDDKYLGYFDIVFAEGGILHYFGELGSFFSKVARYLAPTGTLILNDFHPYRKILFPQIGTNGDYFEEGLHEGAVAYEGRFDEWERKAFPKCLLRYYTIGEIITAIGKNGLRIEEMRELRRTGMEHIPEHIPYEFTIVAHKT
jgi:SAM-dependent methyltransferase